MRRRGQGLRAVRIKGVRRVAEVKGGPIRWKYHRATGLPLPTDVPETSAEFIAAYQAAEALVGQARPTSRSAKPGTVAAVWQALNRSEGWKTLSESYRRALRPQADDLVEKAGHVPFRQIAEKHVRADLSKVEGHQAVKRLKLWRLLARQAMRDLLIDANPTAGISKPAAPKSVQHAPWTADDKARFRAYWTIGTRERLAFEIFNWFGARVNDAVRLGEGNVDRDGWLVYRQRKTGGEVAVPFRRQVPEIADPADLAQLHAALAAMNARHLTFLVTAQGHGRSEKAASQWFAAAARKAGIVGKTAHGLRVSRAIEIAERGGTTHQIGAWLGHVSLDEIEHYSRAAERKRILGGTKPERNSVQKLRS
jgi:integrase